MNLQQCTYSDQGTVKAMEELIGTCIVDIEEASVSQPHLCESFVRPATLMPCQAQAETVKCRADVLQRF